MTSRSSYLYSLFATCISVNEVNLVKATRAIEVFLMEKSFFLKRFKNSTPNYEVLCGENVLLKIRPKRALQIDQLGQA